MSYVPRRGVYFSQDNNFSAAFHPYWIHHGEAGGKSFEVKEVHPT